MLYSERQGNKRGFSIEELVKQMWDTLADEVIGQKGLLDIPFGYDPSEWTGDIADDDSIDGEVANIEQYFNRALKARLRLSYAKSDYVTSRRSYSEVLGYYDGQNNFRQDPHERFYEDPGLFFDFLEVLFGIVSVPKFSKTKKLHTSYSTKEGQKIFREIVNQDLVLYEIPHEMLSNGQIVPLGNTASKKTIEDLVLLNEEGKIDSKDYDQLNEAIRQYYKESSSLIEKKGAILEIHGILEKYRKKVKEELLAEDERDLFIMANSFALRHNQAKQKGSYDKKIWYDWMFNVQLSGVMTIIKILNSQNDS